MTSAPLRKPVTRFGQKCMAEEHYFLAKTLRPHILNGIQTAAAEGDRSENAEYIYGKKRLRETDFRINKLNRLLDKAQIIDPSESPGQQVYFATTVIALKDDEKKMSLDIVGEGETDYYPNGITWKSPVARALLHKKVGEFVDLEVPAGLMELEILEVRPLSKPREEAWKEWKITQ